MQVDPALGGDVEHGLRDERTVGGHRDDVRGDLAQPVGEVRVPGPGGPEHLDPGLGGTLRYRARLQAQPPAGRGVGPGHHRGHLVPGLQQGIERGHGGLRGTGEHQSHEGT